MKLGCPNIQDKYGIRGQTHVHSVAMGESQNG